ncbi:MAG: dihydrolipoamide acetyltransferase family protein [Myxococcota bacterium]
MPQYTFTFPDVGEGIHEAQLVEWLANVGDAIKEDQPLCRVETDKAVVGIPSPVTGVISDLKGAPGEIIHVGDPIAFFELEGTATQASTDASAASTAAPSADVASSTISTSTRSSVTRPTASNAAKILATPHTRALARSMSVDLTKVSGTGRAGRITDQDVERAAQSSNVSTLFPEIPNAPTPVVTTPPVHQQVAQQANTTPSSTPTPEREQRQEGPVERVPMSFLRRKIAEQMARSRQQLVHVTHVEEADITDLFEAYRASKQVLAKRDIKLTPLPYFIKATVACLKEFPMFNSSYDAEKGEMIYKKYYNIGMAVDTPEGLVVPVIRDADRKDIATLATEIRDLAKRARERTLKIEEMRGGTYTITNIGPIGGVFATPIINYPEIAILGLHKIEDRPAVVNGALCVRKRMYLSTSFDHQVIDGGDAARFMRTLAEMLSDPAYLFTRI